MLAGGYLNEHGSLNTKRLQLVLNELNVFEREQFEHEVADLGIGGGGRGGDRHGGGGGHRHRGAKKHAEVKVDKAKQRGMLGEFLMPVLGCSIPPSSCIERALAD